MKTQVIVTTSFECLHCYPDAPDEVAFLRNLHHHTFRVKATLDVQHDDRDQEFFIVQRKLDQSIAAALEGDVGTWSCERWAKYLLQEHGLAECEVWEGEFAGGRVVA